MGERFGLGGGDAGFCGADLAGKIGFGSTALGSEIGLNGFAAGIGDALGIGLCFGEGLFIGSDCGVGLLTVGISRREIRVDCRLALLDGGADLWQGDFAHQNVERSEGNGEPEQLAGEGRRIKWRENVRVSVATMCLGRGMGVGGRIVALCRSYRFFCVGLRYHLVGIPLNPVIRPKAE